MLPFCRGSLQNKNQSQMIEKLKLLDHPHSGLTALKNGLAASRMIGSHRPPATPLPRPRA